MDDKTKNEVEADIASFIEEAKGLLVNLPSDLSFVWDKSQTIKANGVGGTLLKPNLLGIGYNSDFKDKIQLNKNLRATVMHECFHAVQGWSDEDALVEPKTLLEDAVLEGAATAFERDIGCTKPEWASYEDDKTMDDWLKEVKSKQKDPNSAEYYQYKFGAVRGTRWVLYKLGVWIADKAILNNPKLNYADLSTKTAQEILSLAERG